MPPEAERKKQTVFQRAWNAISDPWEFPRPLTVPDPLTSHGLQIISALTLQTVWLTRHVLKWSSRSIKKKIITWMVDMTQCCFASLFRMFQH